MAKPRKFQAERDKVLFAASYLRDLANQWWMPMLTMQPPPQILDDWAMFTTELFEMFGNQHLQTTSQNAILDMSMPDEGRVSEFLVRFNSHAVYTGWNDAALANHFYRGLPLRLKKRFSYIRRPQTLVEMRRYALDFDQNYWEFREEFKRPKPDAQNEQGKGKKGKDKAESANNSPQQAHQSQPTQQSHPNKQQSSGRPNNRHRGGRRPQSGNNNNAGQQNKASSDNQQQSRPRGPLSQQEKDER
jgi:hypothetical protein